MKHILLIIISALILNLQGQNQHLKINNSTLTDPPNIRDTILDFGVSGLETSYSTGQISINEKYVDNELYHQISIPGYILTRDAGKPQLPVFTELIMVPEGAEYSVTYSYSSVRVKKGYKVYPALAPATDRYGDPEPEFAIDSITYNRNAFYPAIPVNTINEQYFRGMKIIWVDISPVLHNPVTGELMIYEDISVQVSFSGAERFFDYSLHSDEFLNNFPLISVNATSIFSEIENYRKKESHKESIGIYSANYIILTDSIFFNAANKFADWKRQLGYSVDLVAGTGWTFNKMKDSVHARYQQWSPKPDYLLIIGDHDRMPAEMLLNPTNDFYGSDLHLVTMGGIHDFIPDMAKGRISVTSASQAMTVIDKIINYEMAPPVDSSFYYTGLNCAQFQDDNYDYFADRRFVHTSEEIRDYLLSKGYDVERVYYADLTHSTPLYYNANYYSNGQSLPPDLLDPSFNWGGNAADITNHINQGVFYVLHRDHGYAGGSGWHAPYFVSSHINSLNNGNNTPIVFSINCHTGEFTQPECFAEKFHRHPNGGAVGVVAASYYSYSGWNDGFSVGMFDAIWASPGLTPNFGVGGFSAPIPSNHNDIRNMGKVMNQGLLRMTQTWSSATAQARYTYRLYHYFGDPAMRIRTKVPETISASHADTIVCSYPLFAISNASYDDAVATLTIPGRIVGKTVLSNGAGAISIDPFTNNYLILTLSGPEHIPYIDTIWVIPSPMTVVYHKEDVKCNGKAEGAILLEISCGVEPINISWAHGSNSPLQKGLTAGTYFFSVTDATNLTISDSVVINQPDTPIDINANIVDVDCYFGANGAISVNVTGGVPPYQYKWSNGHYSANIQLLAAGNYTLSLTDAAGCLMIDTFKVSQPQPLQVSVDVVHDVTGNCTGEATALPTGGTPPYSYLWNDPDEQTTQTASGLCPGLTRVYVTDTNNCITVRSFNIYNISSIQEIDDAKIKIYPNPITGSELFIDIPEKLVSEKLNVAVFNSLGQSVFYREKISFEPTIVIKPFAEQKGIYTLIITENSSSEIITRKIIRL